MALFNQVVEAGAASIYKLAAEGLLRRILKRRLPAAEYERLVYQLNSIRARQWARKGPKMLKEFIEQIRDYFTQEDETECRQVLSQELGGTVDQKSFEEFVATIIRQRRYR